MEYPIKKYDKLNRLIYVDWNGVERVVMIYWENTDKVKIKYRLFHQDQEVIAFDRVGHTVIEISSGSIRISFPGILIQNKSIQYKVSKEKIIAWRQKISKKCY